ncbi:MAG: class I SAM-dependent methyltransferase [Gammaproteobacteria bacterium]|nr:class I SAM-dependent methyltransferase [Gammaproteobacteria bacterium]
MANKQPVLEFTGERFTPECVREIWYEHMHRYAFASRLAEGRTLCDAACGEGYGTALLRQAGAEAVGVDIDADTVAHACQRYGSHYVCASVTALPFAGDSFEVLTSFETIEHLAQQQAMLAEFHRVLRADGLLIISSPDKAQYSDATGYQNPDHVCELYRQEFVALLEQQFKHVRLFGQRLQFASLLAAEDVNGAPGAASNGHCHHHYLTGSMQLITGIAQPAMYWIALCSNDASRLHELDCTHDLFCDEPQSVYAHYNDQVRKNIQAGHDLQARDSRIAELEQRLQALQQTSTAPDDVQRHAASGWWQRLTRLFQRRQR